MFRRICEILAIFAFCGLLGGAGQWILLTFGVPLLTAVNLGGLLGILMFLLIADIREKRELARDIQARLDAMRFYRARPVHPALLTKED